MFNSIRRWFNAITAVTVVKLTADVIELERRIDQEFDWGMRMTRRCTEVSFELKKTREDLAQAREVIVTRDEDITIAESAYRSLLRDYNDQQEQLDQVNRENQKLKKDNESLGMTKVFLEHEFEETKALCDSRNTEVERLKWENEYLRQQLKESIDLTRRYSELADTYYASYERTQNELLLSQTRTQLYRDCYFHRG